nr:hypothetical protein [uncultured Dyadobacter sp.]
MGIQTIRKQKGKRKNHFRFLSGKFGYSNDQSVTRQEAYKSFIVPDFFLQQAEDMGKFLDKNPLPERD